MRISIITLVFALFAPLVATAASPQLDAIREQAENGQPRQALQRLNTYLSQHPGEFDGLLLKGNLLIEAKAPNKAEEIYQRLIRDFPQQPEPYNNLAVLHATEGRYEDAAEVLQQALFTHPSYRAAYENLGKVYGRFASQAYTEALGVRPPEDTEPINLVLLAKAEPSGPTSPQGTSPQMARAQVARPQAASNSRLPQPGQPPARPTVSRPSETSRPSESQRPKPAGPQATQETPTTHSRSSGAAEPAAAVPSTSEEATMEATRPASSPEIASSTDPDFDSNAITQMVRAWARAWSEQRVSDYLDFYSRSFRPESGASREAWAALRRRRVQGPKSIRVVVNEFTPPVLREETASITFTQIYSSDNFSDTMRKSLVLGWEEGAWRILAEGEQP
ncbi:MAG: tetratricopeptide repeat protein [Deltaproteobacteria bacterium]|nr:tetratricopeptide repeat protein [Deltaproteobacteria bacterium]